MSAMTEEEARTRWCPFARDSETAGNRVGGEPAAAAQYYPCIGSRCMAWRWIRTHINDPEGGPDLVPSTRAYGYCGLAGAPIP